MGCTASSLNTLQLQTIEEQQQTPSLLSSSNPKNEIQNPYNSTLTPFVLHPSLHKGDTNHLVCLTSSTYGSFNVVVDNDDEKIASFNSLSDCGVDNDEKIASFNSLSDCGVDNDEKIASFNSLSDCGVDNDEKIASFNSLSDCGVDNDQKIASFNSLSDCGVDNDEKIASFNSLSDCVFDKCDSNMINTWELMEGLEGDDDDGMNDDVGESFELGSLDFGYFGQTPEKPRWDFVGCGEKLKNLSDFHEGNCLKLGFGLSDCVKKLSDDSSFVFVEFPNEKELNLVSNSKPLWQHLCEKTNVTSERGLSMNELGVDHIVRVSNNNDNGDKIVLYYTSLRGIRRTYEDCCSVRMILRGYRVMVEEKDISMDLNYRKELQSTLSGKAMSLPQLFIRGRHIGGAEEIKEMHETGELERLLDEFPVWDRGFVCERCGESRFIPCLNCNGSRKVFYEDEGRTRECTECNENGLVRCPGCRS